TISRAARSVDHGRAFSPASHGMTHISVDPARAKLITPEMSTSTPSFQTAQISVERRNGSTGLSVNRAASSGVMRSTRIITNLQVGNEAEDRCGEWIVLLVNGLSVYVPRRVDQQHLHPTLQCDGLAVKLCGALFELIEMVEIGAILQPARLVHPHRRPHNPLSPPLYHHVG